LQELEVEDEVRKNKEKRKKKKRKEKKRKKIEKNTKNSYKKTYRLGLVFHVRIYGRRRCWIHKSRFRYSIEKYRITPREGELSLKIPSKISKI